MTAYAARTTPWLRHHARGIGICGQVLSLVLVTWFLVVPQLRGSTHSLHLLFHVGSPWLMLALAAELTSLGFYALLTRTLLPRQGRPPLQRVMRIDLSAIALGHCLPDGGAAGTALSWRLLTAEGIPSAQAAFAKVVQGLGSALVLQALLLASYVLGSAASGLSRWEILPAAAAAGILALAALTTFGARHVGFRHHLGRIIRRIPWCGPRLARRLSDIYRRHLVDQLRSMIGNRRTLLLIVCLSGANWAFDALALWASLRAYGAGVGLEALAVAFGLQALATWLPITPSGLGISEAFVIPALIAFGSHRSDVILGLLTWRVLAYWLPIPLGALAFISLRVRTRRSPAAPTTATGRTAPPLLLPASRTDSMPVSADGVLSDRPDIDLTTATVPR